MVKYKIHNGYGTLINLEGDEKQVNFWFINGIPFTFDEIPEFWGLEDLPEDPIPGCKYHIEDLYHASNYLILEECHPLLFEMEELIQNFEDIPY